MEGGTENDLRILEQEEEEERQDKAEAAKKDDPRPPDPERKPPPDSKEEGKKVWGEPPGGPRGVLFILRGLPGGLLGVILIP